MARRAKEDKAAAEAALVIAVDYNVEVRVALLRHHRGHLHDGPDSVVCLHKTDHYFEDRAHVPCRCARVCL